MRRLTVALGLLFALTFTSCTAGPHQLRRSVDDWDNKMYVDSPWLNGVLHFIPVIELASFFAWVGDTLVTDAYAFWFKDAWDGKGTAFDHFIVKPTDGSMRSLLLDDGKFLEIK